MSKKARTASGSRRNDRLAFFPAPVGSPYQRKLYTVDEIADYARERGRQAARKEHKDDTAKKAGRGKRTA